MFSFRAKGCSEKGGGLRLRAGRCSGSEQGGVQVQSRKVFRFRAGGVQIQRRGCSDSEQESVQVQSKGYSG